MHFFGENGEGNDFETEIMEGEDFCGWLIPKQSASDFEPAWQRGDVSEKWLPYMVWAEWIRQGEAVIVRFEP